MKTKYNFWLSFKVEGSNRDQILTSVAVSENAAKSSVKKCFGKLVKVKFIEVINNGVAI